MLDTTSTSSTSTLALDDLGSSVVSELEAQWDIAQLLADTSHRVRSPLEASLRKPAENTQKATAATETNAAARDQAIAEVTALSSQVGERMWENSGRPLELHTVELATEFVRKCPIESFGLGMFNADFTADGDVLLDWDDGEEPALTILVTAQKTVVFSGVYKETEGKRRTNKGNEPWGGNLSPELRQAFLRLVNERAA